MSINKRAVAVLTDVKAIGADGVGVNMPSLIKEAAARFSVDANSSAKPVVDAEVQKHPTALFFRAKAIVADETNANGDHFSCEELVKAAPSFVGVPFYTNHENTDITKAKGKIIFAEWMPNDKAIYVIGFIDREAYPQLCRGVEQEYMRGVSMGCVVEYSECSICDNKAATVEEYCPHIKHIKGRKFTGTAKSVKTGEIRKFQNAHVYERNFGVRFIELSGVGDPACKSCRIQGVIANDEILSKAASCSCGSTHSVGTGSGFMSKVASVENSLMMYKGTALYKQASQEELQQIEQVLQTLEGISVNLIKNRKRVEVEFASDLVKILSELQEFSDELTGAGYGQLQGDAAAGAPAETLPGVGAESIGLPPPAEGVPNASGAQGMPMSEVAGGELGVMPMSEAAPSGPVGTISGSPSNPAIRMPTAPIRPNASGSDRLKRIAELVTTLRLAMSDASTEEGEDVMKRRTPTTASNERASIQHALSGSVKEKSRVSENGIVYGNSSNATGGAKMSESIVQKASRTDAPGVTTERQLDANLANHPRTGTEQNSTGESQLEGKRKGSEPQTTTEDQLHAVRTGVEADRLTEVQVEGLRKDDEANSVTQEQLKGDRTDTEQQELTESQLEGKKADLWARASMQRKTVKTASEHVKEVVDVLADAAIRCSATPSQICAAAAALAGDTRASVMTLDMITVPSATEKVAGTASLIERARYWGAKGVTLASATTEDMTKMVIAGLKRLVARKGDIDPKHLVTVLDQAPELEQMVGDAVDGMLDQPAAEIQQAASIKRQIMAAIQNATTIPHGEAPAPLKSRNPLAPADAEDEIAPNEIAPDEAAAAVERKAERKAMMSKVSSKKPTHVIEASLAEIGTTMEEIKNDKVAAKNKIVAFVKKINDMSDLTVERKMADANGKPILVAGKVKKMKIANITNVNVDGKDGTVQIAIQTDEGDTTADVTVPLDEQGQGVEGAPAEGDATGDNLDSLLGGGTAGTTPAPAAGTPPVAPAPEAPLPTASTKQTVKTAQFGGSGGGLPGGGPEGGGADPAGGLPQGMPAAGKGEGLQSFTEDGKEDEADKAPGVGEQMMPGSICPFCHGTDTTTGKKELPAGAFECNNCGAVYEVHVNIEVLNPENMSFEGGDSENAVTEPKLPEMPVAASMRLDKAGIEKVASCEAKFGHVCPACGMTECKPLAKGAGSVVYACPSCETKSTKEILVASDKSAFMQIAWTLNPKKVFSSECKDCKQAALEYAALVKVTGMMKAAGQANNKPETAFPMANCAEYVSRRWGANAVATFGPCKGKQLAACACKQLEAFGLRKRIDIEKLASVYAQPDPMEKCFEIQKAKGYKQAQADTICKAYRKKYAKEADDNEWLEAFAGDSRFTTEELRVMKQKSNAMLSKGAQAVSGPSNTDFNLDLSAPLDDVKPVNGVEPVAEKVEEDVTVEIPKAVAEQIAKQINTQVVEETPAEGGTPEDLAPIEEAPMEATASGKTGVKVAATPQKVEDISVGVEGKLKGGTGTIGNEQKFDAKKPVIPSNEAGSKIRGETKTIPDAKLPDVATGPATIGGEAAAQKGMPANTVEMRGRVVAGNGDAVKTAAKPKIVEDISSDNAVGKVKGGTGTLGNEGKENIDVAAKAPAIPSRGQGSRIEGEKETIEDATLPDIPENGAGALIEGEKQTQKGMPANINTIRGRVSEADGKRDQQIARIAAARHKKACQVAAKLMGMGRIAEADYDAVIEDLSKIEVDRIEAFAERMFRNVKVASAAPALATPIVQEASVYSPEMPKKAFSDLNGMFTIGTAQLHAAIAEEDARDAAKG